MILVNDLGTGLLLLCIITYHPCYAAVLSPRIRIVFSLYHHLYANCMNKSILTAVHRLFIDCFIRVYLQMAAKYSVILGNNSSIRVSQSLVAILAGP